MSTEELHKPDWSEGLKTIPEVARFLSVSVPKVKGMMKRKEIPFIKIGWSVRFYLPDVLARVKRDGESIARTFPATRRSIGCGQIAE